MRFISTIFALAHLVAAGPLVARQDEAAVTEFARIGGNVESIGVRSNGNLLVSRVDNGQIYQVDGSSRQVTLLVSSLGQGINQAASIVEVGNDVWYVVGGRANVAGSYGVFKIDMNNATAGQLVQATTVATVQGALLLNGMSRGWNDDTLLVGDAQGGAVYKVSISSGQSSAVMTGDSSMAPTQTIPFGIDGVRYVNNTLYFTNIGKQTFNKMSLDDQGQAGNVTQIFSGTPGDDLCFNEAGDAFIATNLLGSVIRVNQEGRTTKLATVQASTCTAFGRTDSTKNTLYVGSGGRVMTFNVPS